MWWWRFVVIVRSLTRGYPLNDANRSRLNSWHPPQQVVPYVSRQMLLSQGEQCFYHALRIAVGHHLNISMKVRLADVVTCSEDDWQLHGVKIAQKHLDFVLCDPHTSEILVAVELDDKSHNQASRQERDQFVDEVLWSCGVVLLHIRASSQYCPLDLFDRIRSAMLQRATGFLAR